MLLASLTNISEHQNFDFNLIQTCWDTMIKINCKNKNHIFTIISRNLKIDWALFTAAFIRMRLSFKCGLHSNSVFIRMRLTFEHDKLYSLKNYWPLFAAAYIRMRPIFECGLYWRAAYNCEITVLCFKVKEQGKTTFKLKMCTLIYLSFFGQITLVF